MGRSAARETSEIKPADEFSVNYVLEFLPPTLQAMVELQRLAGFRSTELCIMRPCDIKKDKGVWIYKPQRHKTEHLNKKRSVLLGPKAQKILKPFLKRKPKQYCFNMPIPTPTKDEKKDVFIGRCMADDKMLTEYPDAAQRYAVCQAQLRSLNTSEGEE